MIDTYTLACRRSELTSTRVTVTPRIRGSRSSNKIAEATISRTSSATRSGFQPGIDPSSGTGYDARHLSPMLWPASSGVEPIGPAPASPATGAHPLPGVLQELKHVSGCEASSAANFLSE